MKSPTRIYLADLAHTYSVEDRSLTIPLGIGYIKAYAHQQLGGSVAIDLFKKPERLMEAVHDEPPDIVGFANYGWNEQLNRAIGAHVRGVAPGALIVAGGPNIDVDKGNRTDFLQRHSYLDYLIVDGGEQPFVELVTWWRDTDRDISRLPLNIVFLDGDIVRQTSERSLRKIIDDIPSPYLSGHLDGFLDAGMIPLFETNRGCPFKCTFCAWGAASKDLVRRMDLDQALAEIAYVGERSDARNWIVCDANFGILKRDVEIAHSIRAVNDRYGRPEKCHIWLAKNVTERNLEIGEILGDMTVPVMAVQSLDDTVLANIKRDNISLQTYAEYQKKFHRIGSRTYSDLIVPLPGETLKSHVSALRELMRLGVDIIQNHNMRLLAGAETNAPETRDRFGFKTRYRLIHGDAGIYRAPDGREIRTFEYEESLRSTTTMSEAELFYLRKLHFLVDFSWNIEAYKPLLKVALAYGGDPVGILEKVIERSTSIEHPDAREFFDQMDNYSAAEWFDSPGEITAYFADDGNFRRLIEQDFEKLNIMFCVLLLRDVKAAFDTHIETVIREAGVVPEAVLNAVAAYCFALYPSLELRGGMVSLELPENYFDFNPEDIGGFEFSGKVRQFAFTESRKRKEVCGLLHETRQKTLSKILNTQGISLRDLRLEPVPR
jgi:radical SAM superfamily enzyme YgiQ (UPF0313 family)